MKKLIFIILFLTTQAFSQGNTTKVRAATSLPATCNAGDAINAADEIALVSGGNTNLYICKQTNTWQQVGGAVTFDQVGVGSNLNVLTVGNAGSLKPVNLGQVAGNQAWLQPGIVAATTSTASTGGSIAASHGIHIVITYNTALGETLPSVEFTQSTAAGTGTNTVTVIAPTLPSGYTGYTVYDYDANAGGTTWLKQTASAACVNITSNCVIGTVAVGAGIPTTNTAIIQPPSVQAGFVPLGGIPSLFFPAVNGNTYPLAGMDFSTTGILPFDGTFEFWHRMFVTDSAQNLAGTTQQGAGLIRNALVSISHLSGQTTSTGSTTDDRVIAVRGTDSLTSPAYEQWLGYYGEQFVYNPNFTCSAPSIGPGEDCIAAVRARSNLQVNTVTAVSGLVGGHFTASTNVTPTHFGSCAPCVVGVIGTADQETVNSQNPGSTYYAGVMGAMEGSSGNVNGNGFSLWARAPTIRFAGQNGGLYIEPGFSSANANDWGIRNNATAKNVFGGPLYESALGTNQGTIAVSGSIAEAGSLGLSQFATPTFSNGNLSILGAAGGTTYTYKVVAKDGNGAASAASAAGTTVTGNATLDTNNFVRITVNFCNGLSGASANVLGYTSADVYRTASGGAPASTGKIGTITPTAILPNVSNLTICNFTLDDKGLAGDSTTPPAANTTGGISVAGDITLTSGKGQHVNTQAANNDFVGTCTAAAATTCTVTFTRAYTAAPICTATDATNITTLKVTPSTSSLIITTTGSSSDVFDYICVGNPN